MALQQFKPKTPALRFTSIVDFEGLTKKAPKKPKKLTKPISKKGGRNNYGHISVRHQGGGHKRKYRVIDFKRDKVGIPARVASVEYDPNRTAFIALLNYADGEKRYILAPLNVAVGDQVVASESADIKPGNALPLGFVPAGTLIHNLETLPGRGGVLVRAAGQYAQLMAKDGEYCQVKLPSGEIRKFHKNCRATIGQISNTDWENTSIGKAGRKRWMGVRPTVRGVVMNPVDHPMGGGEGRASGGHPRSPWGQKAKGLKTRRNKRTNFFIVKRRKK